MASAEHESITGIWDGAPAGFKAEPPVRGSEAKTKAF